MNYHIGLCVLGIMGAHFPIYEVFISQGNEGSSRYYLNILWTWRSMDEKGKIIAEGKIHATLAEAFKAAGIYKALFGGGQVRFNPGGGV